MSTATRTRKVLPRLLTAGDQIPVPNLARVTWGTVAEVRQVDQHTYRVYFNDRRDWIEVASNSRHEVRR